MTAVPSRDDLASLYLDQLEFDPYPVQEEALLAWFTAKQGVLVCTPTGTGKTLIAEAALFEALHTRQVAYYTTPLIALTEQKFREMQSAAVRWGFHPDDVGLVTGNRCVNPDATVRVVVAEILLNRLLHAEQFDFDNVAAVVMDEFHSFSDSERGVVWELSLGLLPARVRLLLLSATVGNTAEFMVWLNRSHGRKVQLVQSTERRIPLHYEWVGERLLDEQLEEMAAGDDEARTTPALVFCFNREECWSVAGQLKGKSMLAEGQQKKLLSEIEKYDWTRGAGPALKQILLRGVGVHHAGVLTRYKRIVEELFQKKLLTVCVCTETLAAGINLPARSVMLVTLLKGPPGKKRLIEPSSAHQMFGRAGRPQFDDRGFVFALAHDDDVKIGRFQERINQIPEDTKDPQLIKARKRLQKKAPTRRKNEQYWNESQFQKLIASPPGKLASTGGLPWRLLAYLLQISPQIDRLREFARRRLMDDKRMQDGQKELTRMLLSLHWGGFVELEPAPPAPQFDRDDSPDSTTASTGAHAAGGQQPLPNAPQPSATGLLGELIQQARNAETPTETASLIKTDQKTDHPGTAGDCDYEPILAHPAGRLDELLVFRSVNPLYGTFLIRHLGIADENERIQALESVLELPGSIGRLVRVPRYDDMPPGPLSCERLDIELVQKGILSADELYPQFDPDAMWEERKFAPQLAEKLRLLFQHEFPHVRDYRVNSVWAAGELLHRGGDFNSYVTSSGLARQEGLIFRHLLRLILLCGEFAQLTPPEFSENEWRTAIEDLSARLTSACRAVDPTSTDKAIEAARAAPDVVKGESAAEPSRSPVTETAGDDDFGAGL